MRVRAIREMNYRSRMLKVGDEFDVTPVDARYLIGDDSVEEIDGEEPARPRRGRPPRQAGAEAPQPTASAPPTSISAAPTLEELTHEQLLDMAVERGVELPPGYVRKDILIDLLQGTGPG
jgi:hypothetical protein